MASTSRHVSELIARPAAEVYAYAADPHHLPDWAAGLAGTSVELVDGVWTADSPMGRVTVEFAPGNDFGVLDHWVTLPSGEVNYNPFRVVAADGGCELLFSVRRRPGMTDDDLERDVEAVRADLATLRSLLEQGAD